MFQLFYEKWRTAGAVIIDIANCPPPNGLAVAVFDCFIIPDISPPVSLIFIISHITLFVKRFRYNSTIFDFITRKYSIEPDPLLKKGKSGL